MIVAVPILFRCTDILCLFANMLTQLSFFKCAELTTFAALIELIELFLTCSLKIAAAAPRKRGRGKETATGREAPKPKKDAPPWRGKERRGCAKDAQQRLAEPAVSLCELVCASLWLVAGLELLWGHGSCMAMGWMGRMERGDCIAITPYIAIYMCYDIYAPLRKR